MDQGFTAPAPTDVTAAAAPEWLSITALSVRDGVSKQAISKRVLRLEAEGSVSTRHTRHGEKFVNVAQFDRAIEDSFLPQQQSADTVRERRFEESGSARLGDPTLTDAQTAKILAESEIRKLDLAERRRLTLPIGGDRGVEAAMTRAAGEIVRVLDRIPARSADVTAAARKEGEHGVRRLLRQLVVDVRTAVATALQALHAEGDMAEGRGPYQVDLPLAEDDAA